MGLKTGFCNLICMKNVTILIVSVFGALYF
jgi:hypothetical protein